MPIDWAQFREDTTVAEPPLERLDDTADPVTESETIDWSQFREDTTEPKVESQNLLQQVGTGLREAVSPLLGRTPSQKQRDFQATLAADSQAALKLIDEKGNLRGTSEGALNAAGRGIQQLGNIGVAVDLALADTLGADKLSAWLLERYKKNQAEIAASAPAVPTWESVGKGYGNDLSGLLNKTRQIATYGIERLGENVPNIGLSMIGGGVGGYLAKKVVTKGLTGAAAEAALAAAGKKIALGATIGAIPPAVAIEMGSIYGDMVEHDIRDAVPATVALLAALPAGMLEALTPALLVNRIAGKGVASPISSFLRSTMGTTFMKSGVARLGVAGLEGAITEGPTEWVQTAIEQAARISQDPKTQGKFWEEFFSEASTAARKEAAIAGVTVGGFLGGGAHGLGRIGQRAEEERAAAVKAAEFQDQLRVLGLHATAAALGEGTAPVAVEAPPATPGPTAASTEIEGPPAQPEVPALLGETVAAAKAPSVMEQELGQAVGSRGLGEHVVVISDPSQLPPAAIEDMRNRKKPVDPNTAPALYHDGKVYFIASHSAWQKEGRIDDLIVHEVFIHKGLRTALGPENFSQLVEDIWGTLSNADRLVIRENQGLRADQTGIIGEEWLARKAEEVARRNVSDNLWARIVVALKRAARKYGLKLQWTDLEIARLIAKGSEAVGQKTAPGEGQGATRLSVEEDPRQAVAKSMDPMLHFDGTQEGFGRIPAKDLYTYRALASPATFAVPENATQEQVQAKFDELKQQFSKELAGPPVTRLSTVPEETPGNVKPKVAKLAAGKNLTKLGDPIGTSYYATPADWAEWQRVSALPVMDPGVWPARERMKNKYGGMPPVDPDTDPDRQVTRLAVEQLTPEQTANIKSQIVGVKAYLRQIERSFSYQRYQEQTPEVIATTAILEDRKSYLEERLAALEARIGQVSEVKPKVTKVALRTEISKLKARLKKIKQQRTYLDTVKPTEANAEAIDKLELERIESKNKIDALENQLAEIGTIWRPGQSATAKFDRQTELVGSDIISFIIDVGPHILDPSVAKKRDGGEFWRLNQSEYDGMPVIPRRWAKRIFSDKGALPSTVAHSAQQQSMEGGVELPGFIDGTSDEIWEALDTAMKVRDNAVADKKAQEKEIDVLVNKYEDWEQATSQKSGRIQVFTSKLAAGDKMVVDGQPVTVTKVSFFDPSVFDGGPRFGDQRIEPDQSIWVDEYTPVPRPELTLEPDVPVEPAPAKKPKGPKATQQEMFVSFDSAFQTDDLEAAFDAAIETYGSAAKAIVGINNQMAVIDADPELKKNYTEKQRKKFTVLLQILGSKAKLDQKGGESNAREIKGPVEVPGGEAPSNVAPVAEGTPGGVRKPVGPQKEKVVKYVLTTTGKFRGRYNAIHSVVLNAKGEQVKGEFRKTYSTRGLARQAFDKLNRELHRESKGGENIEEKEKVQVGQPPAPPEEPEVLTPGEEADLFNALSVMGGKATEQQQTKAQQDASKKAAELQAAKDLYKKNKTTRLAVEPSPIANAFTDAELIALGFEPTRKGLRKPDAVLAATVQARMIRNPQWVPTLVEAQTKKPTMLTDEEVLAIDWYKLNRRIAHATAAKKGMDARDMGKTFEAANHFKEAEGQSALIRKLAVITRAVGTLVGRALRARQLALNEEFEVSNMLIAAQEKNGWIPLSQEEIAEIVKQSEQLKQKLADEIALTNKQRGELADMELELARAKLGEKAQVHPDVLKFASNWVAGLKKKRDEAKAAFDADWAAVEAGGTRLATEGPAPTEPRQLPPQLMEKVAIVGAYQLSINNVSKAGWETAMVAELGERIRPYLDAARIASEAQLQAELKVANKEYTQVIKTPRKPKPTPTTPQTPTEPRTPRPEREPSEEDEEVEELPVEERIDDVTERLRKRIEIADRDGKEPRIFGLVQQLVRLLVEQNPTINRDEMVSIVHGILTPLIPGITEIETMDAISGRGRFTEPDQEENAKHLRELKAQIRMVAHNMDVISHRPRPKTGMGRDPRSDEVRNLERILNESRHIYGDVVTDPEHQLRTFLDARKKWFENAITDLNFEIEHRKRILKPKMLTGTDAELEAMKVEYKKLVTERDAIFFDPAAEAAHQLELLEKAAQRQIDRLQGQIESGNIFPPGKKPKTKKATSDKLEALNGEIEALERERDYARMALQPAPEIQDKANLARALALEKEIQAIQADIEANAPFVSKTKEPTEEADFNVERAARLQAKKAELAQLRNESGYNLERGIQLRIMQIQRGTAEYAKRISENNFLPKTKKQTADIVTDPRILKVQAEAEIIKQKYYQALHDFEMRNKTKMEKFWIGIKRTPGAIINLKSSFDFSAMRQALPAIGSLTTRTLTHPIGAPLLIAKIFRKMFSATWSDQRAFAEQKRLDARFNRRSGADAKVDYMGLDSHSFTPGEENARSIFDEWAQLPFRTGSIWKSGLTSLPKLGARGVRASNRAFVTFLNVTRAVLFDELVSANFKDRPPTQVELDVISNYVNIATGRGKMPANIAKAASWVFWAPKLFTSRAQLLIGQPLWGGGARAGSGRARKIIALEYVRLLASGALLALVSGLFDDKKEEDPKSSDYGKIVRGNVRIDLWGGFQQLIVLANRFLAQETKTAKGRVQKANLAEVFWRFLRTKLRPDTGVVFDWATRQDLMGEKFSYAEAAKDLIIPLPWTDVLAILKDRGFSETVAIQLLNQFGAGVSINDREKRGRNY